MYQNSSKGEQMITSGTSKSVTDSASVPGWQHKSPPPSTLLRGLDSVDIEAVCFPDVPADSVQLVNDGIAAYATGG